MLAEFSHAVTGREAAARPALPRRGRETDSAAPKTIVVRRAEPGQMARADLAARPHSVRPGGYYEGDKPIPVPTY
jgi:hypothetical protein